MIDCLVPVLDRPQNAAGVAQSFFSTTSPLDRLTFLCSQGDYPQIDACFATAAQVRIMDFKAGPGDYARKMNRGYQASTLPFLFLGADDIEFQPGWREQAMRAMSDKRHVVATNDMANAQVRRGEFGTHCLVRRSYVDELGGSADGPGVLLHEGYDHNFVDRELCALAQARCVYAFARRSIVKHRHHLWKTAPLDATYEKGIKNFSRDQKLFLRRSLLWGGPSDRGVARRGRRDIVRR